MQRRTGSFQAPCGEESQTAAQAPKFYGLPIRLRSRKKTVGRRIVVLICTFFQKGLGADDETAKEIGGICRYFEYAEFLDVDSGRQSASIDQ